MSTIAQRRLIRNIKEGTNVSVRPDFHTASLHSLQAFDLQPPAVDLEESTKSVYKEQRSQKFQKVYYIFCKNLFKRNVPQQVVSNLSLETDPLELVISIIAERHKCSLQTYALELYSQEGYPLCVNEYNQKC